MTRRRSSPLGLELVMSVVLALVVLPSLSRGAPVQEAHTQELQRYSEGCYYNFNHYSEGDRIITNEPCLNCTCHNRMLMCYLRVCPFTKPIGHDCIVEKREDQCCPIITCPEVPVNVSHHSNQLTTHEPGTELSIPEKYGCSIDSKFYPEGALLPINPTKPCELCYCIRNRTSCLIKECTLHIDGCQPVYNKGSCCPVRYNCDHENELLEIEDHSTTTTTVRPTTGFVLSSTSSPIVSTDCIHNNEVYADGASIAGKDACEHCYCMRGDIVCAVQKCDIPTLESGAKLCRALPPAEDECCPSNYVCDDDSAQTEIPLIGDITTQKFQPGLHESVSQEDVQLQEHIDDKAVATETPLKSDEQPDSEFGSGDGIIYEHATDSPVISKVTQGALKPQDEDESPAVATTSSINETTHETTITPIEHEDSHTVISEDKEYDSSPSSAPHETPVIKEESDIATTYAPVSEEVQKEKVDDEKMPEIDQSTIASSAISDEDVGVEEDVTTIRSPVESGESADADESVKEKPIETVKEEAKPTVSDVVTEISTEKGDKVTPIGIADEENKATAIDATTASVEVEDKVSTIDATTLASVVEEDKFSVTAASTSVPVQEVDKAEPVDTTTIASVGEGDKATDSDAATTASVEEGDNASDMDLTTIISVEEGDKSSTSAATIVPAVEDNKPIGTEVPSKIDITQETSTEEEEEEEDSTELASPPKAHIPPEIAEEDEAKPSKESEESPEDSQEHDRTTVSPIFETIAEGDDSHVAMPESGDHTSHDTVPLPGVSEEGASTTIRIDQGIEATVKPVLEEEIKKPESGIQEQGSKPGTDSQESSEEDTKTPLVTEKEEEVPAIVEEVTQKTTESTPLIVSEDKVEIEATVVPIKDNETTEESTSEEKIQQPTESTVEDQEIKKITTAIPIEEPSYEKETTVSPTKNTVEDTSSEEDKSDEQSGHSTIDRTTIAPSDSKESTSDEEQDADEQPAEGTSDLTTSAPHEINTQPPIVEKDEEIKPQEPQDIEKQPGQFIDTSTISAPSIDRTETPIAEDDGSKSEEETQSGEISDELATASLPDSSTQAPITKDESQSEEEGSGASSEEQSTAPTKIKTPAVTDTERPIIHASADLTTVSPSVEPSEETSSEEELIEGQPGQGIIDSTTISPVYDEDSGTSPTIPSAPVDMEKPAAGEDATKQKPTQQTVTYSTTSAPSLSDFMESTSSEEDELDEEKTDKLTTITPIAIDLDKSTSKDEEDVEQKPHHDLDLTTVTPSTVESQKPSDKKPQSGQPEESTFDSTTISSSVHLPETEEVSSESEELDTKKPYPSLVDATTVPPTIVESEESSAEKEQTKDKVDENELDSTTIIPPAAQTEAPSLEETKTEDEQHIKSDVPAATTVLPSTVEEGSTEVESSSEKVEDKKRPDVEIPEPTTVASPIIDTKKTSAKSDEEQQPAEDSRPTTLSPTEESDELSEAVESAEGSGMPMPDVIPPAIPGEGDCLVNEQTYKNNDTVPVSSECEVSCTCVSSIVVCKRVQCNVPPKPNNCILDETSTNKCCPEYICGYDSFSDNQRPTTPEEIDDGEIQFTTLPPPKKYPETSDAAHVEKEPLPETNISGESEEATSEEDETSQKPKETTATSIPDEAESPTQRPIVSDDSHQTEQSSVAEEPSTTAHAISSEEFMSHVKDSEEQAVSVEGSAEGSGEEEEVSTEEQEQVPSISKEPSDHALEPATSEKPTYGDKEASEPAVTKSPTEEVQITEQQPSTPGHQPSPTVEEDNIVITTQPPSEAEKIQPGTDKPAVAEEDGSTIPSIIIGVPKIDESIFEADNTSETSAQTTPSSQSTESQLDTDAPSLTSMIDSNESSDSTESQEIFETPGQPEKKPIASEEVTTSTPLTEDITTIKTVHTDLEGEIQAVDHFESNTIIPEIIYHKPEMPEDMSHTKVEEAQPAEVEPSKPVQPISTESDESGESTEKTPEASAAPIAPISTILTPVYTPEKEPERVHSHADIPIQDKKDEGLPTEINIRKDEQPTPIEAIEPITSTVAPGSSEGQSISDTTEPAISQEPHQVPTTVIPSVDEKPIGGTIAPVSEDKTEGQTLSPSTEEHPLPGTETAETKPSKEGEDVVHAVSTPTITDETATSTPEIEISVDSNEIVPETPISGVDLGVQEPTSGQDIYESSTKSSAHDEEDKEEETISGTESTEGESVPSIPAKQDEPETIPTKPIASPEQEDSFTTIKLPADLLPVEAVTELASVEKDDVSEESSEAPSTEEGEEEKEDQKTPQAPAITEQPISEEKQPIDKTLLTTENAMPEGETSRPMLEKDEQGDETTSGDQVPLSEAAVPTSPQPEDEGYSTESIVETSKPALSQDDQSTEDEMPISSNLEPIDDTTQQPAQPVSADHTSTDEGIIDTSELSEIPTEKKKPITEVPQVDQGSEQDESSEEEKTDRPSLSTDLPHAGGESTETVSEKKPEEPLSEEKTESSVLMEKPGTDVPLVHKESEEPVSEEASSSEEKTESSVLAEKPGTEIPHVDKESEKPVSEEASSSEEKTESSVLAEKPGTEIPLVDKEAEEPVSEEASSSEEKTESSVLTEKPRTEIPLVDKEVDESVLEEKPEAPTSEEKTENTLLLEKEKEKPATEIPVVDKENEETLTEEKTEQPFSEEKTEVPLLDEKPISEISPIEKESGLSTGSTETPISETSLSEEQTQTVAPAIKPDEIPAQTEVSAGEQSTEESSPSVPSAESSSVETPVTPQSDDQQLGEKVATTLFPEDSEQPSTSPPKYPIVPEISEETTSTSSEEESKEGAKEPSVVGIVTERGDEPITIAVSTQAPHKVESPEEQPLPTVAEEISTSLPEKSDIIPPATTPDSQKHDEGITSAPASEEPIAPVEDKFETDLPKPIVADDESSEEDETPLLTTAHPLFPHLDLDRTTSRPVLNATDKLDTESRPTPTTPQPITSAPTSHYQPPSYGHVPPQYPSYPEDEYTEEDETEIFGPGTCRYGGKLFVSAQQIPRDDPCDFCFCFRSDIICLQQSCPPPISGCHEEPISGFCCPRYECPVSMATVLNITTSTTTTSTTLPPHFLHHAYRGAAEKNGCHINGKSYKVGEPIDSASGPCMHCTCGGDGQMKCDPKTCSPEPMLRQMIAVVASRRR